MGDVWRTISPEWYWAAGMDTDASSAPVALQVSCASARRLASALRRCPSRKYLRYRSPLGSAHRRVANPVIALESDRALAKRRLHPTLQCSATCYSTALHDVAAAARTRERASARTQTRASAGPHTRTRARTHTFTGARTHARTQAGGAGDKGTVDLGWVQMLAAVALMVSRCVCMCVSE